METKSLIKTIAVIAAVATSAISATALMVGSYNEYQEYYQNILEEKAYQEYLNSLGLEFVNLTVELKDGVGYYTDGLARPKNDDVIVRAHFTEKGREFNKKVDSDDFTLEYSEDFAQNGGKIKVTYSYQPEKEEGAEVDPEPIVKEAEIEVSLIKVALEGLKVTKMPNRVYYSDDMEFDARGLELEARFNNGHTAKITYKDIEVKTTGKLPADLKGAEVSYTVEGVSVSTLVPITVVTKASYEDGEIMSIEADEGATAVDGQKLSDVKLNVRAHYKNGNKLYIKADEYTIVGNTDIASFNYNCILTVKLKSNYNITCKTVAAVVYNQEVENAETEGGKKKTISEYQMVDGELVEAGSIQVMDSFENGSTVKFKVNAQNLIKGDLYLRATTSEETSTILANTISVKINGGALPVRYDAVVTKGPSYVFNNYRIMSPVLMAGENEVEITFKNIDPLKVQLDKIVFETKYEGSFSESMTDYLIDSQNEGRTLEVTTDKIYGYKTIAGGSYIHGICTDGTYLYTLRTTYSSAERRVVVTKNNMQTGEDLATSPQSAQIVTEATAGITYHNGKIVIFGSDGKQYAINASLSGSWEEYDGFKFKDSANLIYRDVSYASGRQEYAVLVDSVVHVYNADKELTHKFNTYSDDAGSLKRMYANEQYIYAIHSKDGAFNPAIQVYDWSGARVTRVSLPHDLTTTSPEVKNTAKTNCQGLVVTNDKIYYSFLKFSSDNGGDAAALMKVSYPEVKDELEYKLTLGEYSDVCSTLGVEGTYTAKGIDGGNGTVEAGSGYAMAAVTDGRYTYYSINQGENASAIVAKVDSLTHELVAKSKVFNYQGSKKDACRMFIKDGVLYVIGFEPQNIFTIETEDFVDGCELKLDDKYSFNDVALKAATWNEEVGKYAVITTNDNLCIARENKTFEKQNISLSLPSSWKVGSVAADDKYVYVNYLANNKSFNYIDLYRWDGAYVGRITVNGFTLGTDVQFNVQSVFVVNGELRAIVCSWTSGHQKVHEWRISVDTSVLQ